MTLADVTYLCFVVLNQMACIPQDQADLYGVYVQHKAEPYVNNQVIITSDNFSGIQITYPVGSPYHAPVLNDPKN